jgi:hypothetical protein
MLFLIEEAKGYKMHRPWHNKPGRTYSKVLKEDLRKRFKEKWRAYLEDISLDLEEENERGVQLGC